MKIVNAKKPFTYASGETPVTYKCQICGQTHVKLWRKSHTFLNEQTLVCASCLSRMHKEGKFTPQFKQGHWLDKHGYPKSDQLGIYLPAVPTEENDTFWGYTSVPKAGCNWWNKLPDGM